jgi:hypothetical protein
MSVVKLSSNGAFRLVVVMYKEVLSKGAQVGAGLVVGAGAKVGDGVDGVVPIVLGFRIL